MSRPTKDEYFFDIAVAVSKRATCSRASVGCVLVKDDRIISTGYNGAISGSRHCSHVDGFVDDVYLISDTEITDGIPHCKIVVHAEVNCITYCARRGVSCDGAIAYVNKRPCEKCVMFLNSAGITDIRYRE